MGRKERQGFFVSGGTLPASSPSYLERETDHALLRALLAGQFCYVLNSRQLGKSSLSVRVIGQLKVAGVRTVFLDLTRIGGQTATPEQWYMGLAFEIARELKFFREAVEYWRTHADQTLVQRLFGLIRELALPGGPFVIFIDEIDATRSLSFDPDEFFAGIRECYNRRASEPEFGQLSFCLIGVGVPSDLVRNRATTPFNIGVRVRLNDFTLEELNAYSDALGVRGREVIARVHFWTGGHPFLTQSLCQSVAELPEDPDPAAVDRAVEREFLDPKARESNINLADVANLALHYGEDRPHQAVSRADLLTMYGRILAGRHVVDDESNREVVLLKLSGLVKSDGRRLSIRNRIYKRVFDKQWIEEHMPAQELRRQRQSYRRGVLRTALISGAILAIVSGIAAFAWVARLNEIEAEKRLSYQLYVADMNSLRLFYENGDADRIERILERHRNSPYRGFEWGFWLARHHDSPEEYALNYKAAGKRVEGHISRQGDQVCIFDPLSQTATVVDRTSKRTIVSVPAERVVPLASRWINIPTSPEAFVVQDILTGKRLSVIGSPEWEVRQIHTEDHSDLIAVTFLSRSHPGLWRTGLYNVVSGKLVHRFVNIEHEGEAFVVAASVQISFSPDGRFVAYPRGPFKPIPNDPNQVSWATLEVLELPSGKVIDRFPVSSSAQNVTQNFDGSRLLIRDVGGMYIRDIRARRSTPWVPQNFPDAQVASAIFSENYLLAIFDGGRCVAHDLTGRERDTVREDVNWVAPGAYVGQYLAGSSSVRIYGKDTPRSSAVVTDGRRVTRFGPGVLNIFRLGDRGLARVRMSDFKTRSHVPVPDPGATSYTGRWLLVHGNTETLKSVTGDGVCVPLPFAPAQWSCGKSADSILLWQVKDQKLIAFDGRRQAVRWERPTRDLIGLWVTLDGSRALVETAQRDVAVLDMANGNLLGRLTGHNLGTIFVSLAADGKRAFTCGGDGTTIMWDITHIRKLMTFYGNGQYGITCADLSPDGRRVATATRSGSWQLWDASNGVQLLDVPASTRPLNSVVFNDDGSEIVTAGEDSWVRLWRSVRSDPTTYVPLSPNYLTQLHQQ